VWSWKNFFIPLDKQIKVLIAHTNLVFWVKGKSVYDFKAHPDLERLPLFDVYKVDFIPDLTFTNSLVANINEIN
jgi:hypothetical protein